MERRELGDRWYAVKWPQDREWTLKRDGVEYISRASIRELHAWIETRKAWRSDAAIV